MQPVPGDLDARHVVVTGGGGGLGSDVVKRLREAGAICHLPPPRTAPSGVDFTDERAVAQWFERLPAAPWASIHLIGGFTMAPLEATSLADLRAMFDVNAVTCFLACREAARRMSSGGRIVNVAARPALEPAAGMAAYAMAKAAVAALTRSLAVELAPRGILVNAVVPSIIDTPANRRAMPAADHGRWPKPAEVAEAILFLASPRNTLTSGALLPVYGRS